MPLLSQAVRYEPISAEPPRVDASATPDYCACLIWIAKVSGYALTPAELQRVDSLATSLSVAVLESHGAQVLVRMSVRKAFRTVQVPALWLEDCKCLLLPKHPDQHAVDAVQLTRMSGVELAIALTPALVAAIRKPLENDGLLGSVVDGSPAPCEVISEADAQRPPPAAKEVKVLRPQRGIRSLLMGLDLTPSHIQPEQATSTDRANLPIEFFSRG